MLTVAEHFVKHIESHISFNNAKGINATNQTLYIADTNGTQLTIQQSQNKIEPQPKNRVNIFL